MQSEKTKSLIYKEGVVYETLNEITFYHISIKLQKLVKKKFLLRAVVLHKFIPLEINTLRIFW